MQIGSCCAGWYSGSVFFVWYVSQIPVLCSGSQTCNFLCGTSPLWFYFCQLFLSTSPPPREAGSVRAQTAQGLLGLAPRLRRKYQPCLLGLGQRVPGTAGVLFCTFCLESGTAGVPGELQLPALSEAPIHCHGPPVWFILCKARLQLQALKPDCCRLCSCATPCRLVTDRHATAGLNQEVKSHWCLKQTPVQKIKTVFGPLSFLQLLLTSTHCVPHAGTGFFPPFQKPIVQRGANMKTKSWAWETSIRPDRPIILCPGSGKTSHRRCCFIQIWRITEFNKEK